jgi:hypothetical protein
VPDEGDEAEQGIERAGDRNLSAGVTESDQRLEIGRE